MTTILILLLCAASACSAIFYLRLRAIKQKSGKLKVIEHEIADSQSALSAINNTFRKRSNEIEDIVRQKITLENQIKVAEATKTAAIQLAAKELELEREKHLSEFNQKLEEDKKQLLAESDITKYKQELEQINIQIETARQTLTVQQEQALNAAKIEDFISFHSIELTPKDLKDIESIRAFAPQLTRQEAVFKLIWTEYIQKPIQALCKTTGAEKVCGIYKITNIQNNRMYIGQAVDIASRWKEHCKCGLGIGTTSYLTNKFYKALHTYGTENFTFEVLEICPNEKLNERESYWINFFNAVTFGYNSKVGG